MSDLILSHISEVFILDKLFINLPNLNLEILFIKKITFLVLIYFDIIQS